MKEEIPYMTPETAGNEIAWQFPIPDLVTEIVDRSNMENAFDYVISHLETANQRDHIRPKKKQYVDRLIQEISSGTFRITENDFRTLRVTDGPKERIVQCPTVYHRVGCHAIMTVFEKYTYPTLITNTGASIKGRGMHWLFHIIEEDMKNVPDFMRYFYQCDICHYYDNISQMIMKWQIRQYVSDPVLLPILYNFVELLPEEYGISKGLRSSQCFANLHLSEIDHKMCAKVKNYIFTENGVEVCVPVSVGKGELEIKGVKVRFLYYRYCDDIVIFASTKKELWLMRDYLVSLLAELGLSVKPSEAVRPLSEGCDFLGFKNYGTHALIRKRTKQKFARGLARVKSRKRRQKLIGSFFGMASHADCKHLLKTLLAPSEYKRLKHKRKMKDFGEFKLKTPTLDGKKNFRGNKIYPRELSGQGFIVVDFERGVVARRDKDDYNRRLQDASARGISPDFVEKPKDKYVLQVIYHQDLQEIWRDHSVYEGTESQQQENRKRVLVRLNFILDNIKKRGELPKLLNKMWTGDRDIWNTLDQLDDEDEIPFFSSIEMDYSGQFPKAYFVSAAGAGLRRPTDEEVDLILNILNLK